LVLSNDKQDWQTFSQTNKKEAIKDQVNKIKGKKGYIRTNMTEIQRSTKKYFENLYSNELARSRRNG
jgi:hypothetical protein